MLLNADSLGLRRGREWLFRELGLSITAGQAHWLRGANGKGKTSLLRVLVGLTTPDEGTIRRHDAKRPILYLGHTNALKDNLSACEALQFLTDLHGLDASPDSVQNALHRLGVEHRARRLVRTLSQGQKRRVALARLALDQRPGLWVLDEPFDALDEAGCAVVRSLIGEHLQRGGAVIMTSHVPFDLPGVELNILDLDQTNSHHA